MYVVVQSAAALVAYHSTTQDIAANTRWMAWRLAQRQQIKPVVDQEAYAHLTEAELEKVKARMQVEIDYEIAQFQAYLASPPVVQFSRGEAVLEAILRPLSGRSNGSIVGSAMYTTYPAPITIHRIAVGRLSLDFELIMGATAILALHALAGVGLPLSLSLLPVSRRRAKVKWSHIVRAAVYGQLIPIVSVCLFFGYMILGAAFAWFAGSQFGVLIACVAFGPLVFLVCWWWAAIRFYMRIPHALFVATTLAVLVYLLIPSAVIVVGTLFDSP
jgi:hypothetical protein